MPIDLSTIDRHKHILMYDDERLVDALVAFRHAGGSDWWYLIVDLEGGYAVARFSDLVAALEQDWEKPLSDFVGHVLHRVDVVIDDQQADMAAVQEQAFNSDSQVAVILHKGEFYGVLPVGVTRSAGMFSSKLLMLAGEMNELPEKGLVSRRRQRAIKKKQAKKDKKNG